MRANPIVGQGTSLQQWQASRHLAELPSIDILSLVPPGARAVIVAPHPDDEVLGCGGLLQVLAAAGRPLQLISVTDGSASHPGSARWPVQRLSVVRPQESAEALRRLGLPMHRLKWLRGGFTDSQVAAQEAQLCEFIERHLRPQDVLLPLGVRTAIATTRPSAAPVLKLRGAWARASMSCRCGRGTGQRPKTRWCLGNGRARFSCHSSKSRANAMPCMPSPANWKVIPTPV